MRASSVLVIGGGAFGTSTAYHLSHRGYSNVTVLDRFEPPSKDAASTDLNKIVRYDYTNPIYTRLALEAMSSWKQGIFAGMFRPTGWILAAHDMTREFVESVYETSRKAGRKETRFMSTQDTKLKWPEFTGSLEGWINLWSPEAGWVPSGEALLRMARAAEASGVSYVTGESGRVQKLLFNDAGTCVGALASNGQVHFADTIVLCTGANTALLVEAENEIVARSHCIGVVQLAPEEAKKYQRIPIVDDFEQGILFPPDAYGAVKICSCRFITNYCNSPVPGASVSHSHEDFPEDGVPRQIEREMRDFVRQIIPEIADRSWESTRMCWDGDTRDLNFPICPSPTNANLFIATAGSGHGFKFMPTIGKYVVDMIEDNLNDELRELWKWRFGQATPPQGKVPHPWPVRDLGELDGWKGRNKHVV